MGPSLSPSPNPKNKDSVVRLEIITKDKGGKEPKLVRTFIRTGISGVSIFSIMSQVWVRVGLGLGFHDYRWTAA